MRINGKRFTTDRAEGKLLGVCAGIAEATGLDATLVRVGLVVGTLAGGWPWTVLGYLLLAWLGRPERGRLSGTGWKGRAVADESAERMRLIDLRLQAIETEAAATNSRLAREIEDLR
jgi:phage shock protein C